MNKKQLEEHFANTVIRIIGNRSMRWLGIKTHFRKAESLKNKDRQRFTSLQKRCLKIMEPPQNNVPQHTIVKILNSPSEIHNIIKRYQESEEVCA